MSIKAKAVRGAIWSAIQGWGNQVGSLAVFLVLARLLTPDDFGLVALANVCLAFMQIFLQQGFAQALIQRQKLDPEHLDTAFWTNLAIGIGLMLATITGASWVASQLKQPQLAPILQTFSVLFLIVSLSSVQQAILERKFAFKAIAIRSLLGTLIGGIAGITLAVRGFGVWSLVGQQLVGELVGVLFLWGASDWRPGFKVSRQHFQQLFGFGINILAFNFLGFINNRSDDLLIGYFLGTKTLGYYAIAYRFLTVMTQLLVNTSSQVALPTFSRLQEDPVRFRQAFYTVTQVTSLIAFPVFLGSIIVAPELIETSFGKQWLPSVPVMQILALVGILRSVTYFKGSVFLALGKPAWRLWLGLLSATLNLIGFFIAVRWGIVAVSCAYLARACLVFPIGQWAISRSIDIPLMGYLRQFIAPLSSALIMAIAVLVTKHILSGFLNSLLVLIVCTLVGAIAYGLAIRFLAFPLWQNLKHTIELAFLPSKDQNP